jgi:chemotaxis protein MotB
VLHLTDDTIRFPQRSATLDEEARKNVEKIAHVLTRVLPAYVPCRKIYSGFACQDQMITSIETIFIEGHTDIIGPDSINWDLSAQRAANTYRELTAVSLELRQFLNREMRELLSISGYSSTRPRDGDLAALDKNRRTDLRFVMDTNVAADFERFKACSRTWGRQSSN